MGGLSFPAMYLNEQQLSALSALSGFLEDSNANQYGLFGYAGTGKSTVLSYLSNMDVTLNKRIVMAAPTHKAVGVLASMAQKHDTGFRHFKTVAHLLNLRKQVNYETGDSEFRPTVRSWSEANINKYDVVIIDECSMVKYKEHGWINAAINALGCKVLYVGDPLQLPPVTEEDINGGKSLAFNVPEYSLLKRVERFGGAIGDVVHGIRNNINKKKAYRPRFENCDDIARLKGTKAFFDEFMEYVDTAQIIGYRNKWVNRANGVIRRRLFGKDVPAFVPGERVVAKSSSQAWHAQEEFVVREAERTEHMGIPCWFLRFENKLFGAYTCDAEQRHVLTKELRERKQAALHLSKEIEEAESWERSGLVKARNKAWKDYHDLKDAFGTFRPAYAQTIHASQGSTYPQVFIMERDIHTLAYDPLYHGKMLYVAYSRAADLIRVV